jgi:Mg-chelatase subunit ChlD
MEPGMTNINPSSVHVCLILDASGSMQAVYEDALGAVNGYLMRGKQDRNLYEARFSLVVFNSHGVETVRNGQILETVKPLAHEEYRCGGMTPLYDAVGRGVGILDEALGGKPGKAILVIMTDGLENASLEFDHAKITALIKARQDAGWLVTFLGEGLDVAKQGTAMGATPSLVATYSGGQGLRAAGEVLAASSVRYVEAGRSIRRALADAALTPEERDALSGKK